MNDRTYVFLGLMVVVIAMSVLVMAGGCKANDPIIMSFGGIGGTLAGALAGISRGAHPDATMTVTGNPPKMETETKAT